MVHAINLDHSIREISYTFFLDNFNMHECKKSKAPMPFYLFGYMDLLGKILLQLIYALQNGYNLQDWILESQQGYKKSDLASQCTHR